MSQPNLIIFSHRLKDFPHPEGTYTGEYWLDEGQFWYNVESPQGVFQTQDQPEEIIDLTPDLVIKYNSNLLLAFKDAPGWYVYAWSILNQVRIRKSADSEAGVQITAQGYKIIAGPFAAAAEAQAQYPQAVISQDF